MNVMCNYSDLVEERGIEKGVAEGKILARYEDGMLPGEIARKMGMTVEQVKDVLARNHLPVKAETLPII